MQKGIALVPENRALEAAFPDLTVAENLSAGSPATSWRGMRLDRTTESAEAAGLIEDFGIKTPSAKAPLGNLSGGNQQKVVTARWMHRSPRVLLLDEPTQGVDVGARSEIHSLIRSAAQGGTAVIVASSDAEELVQLSDRVIVLIEGRVGWEVDGDDLNGEQISRLIHAEKEAV
jgi:ribose transport system ATP-binding protein